MDIVYIRAYNGSLIAISKVNLVTVDPNSGKIVNEFPLSTCIEKIIQSNLNNFNSVKDKWQMIDNYNMIEEVKK
jgi:hypothetical protein